MEVPISDGLTGYETFQSRILGERKRAMKNGTLYQLYDSSLSFDSEKFEDSSTVDSRYLEFLGTL